MNDRLRDRNSFRNMKTRVGFIILVISLQLVGYGQDALQDNRAEVHALVTQIYSEVSGEGLEAVNWDKVREFFQEDAVIILRTSRDETKQFTVDQFIQDFKDFYQSPRVRGIGFKEEVVGIESRIYHEMAWIGVVYSATILNTEPVSQKGIDFWLLTRTGEGWKVVAVTNEVIPADGELPAWVDAQIE